MQNIKRGAERPGKYQFAVLRYGTICGDAMGATEDPFSDSFLTVRPKEEQTDAVKHFMYTHVPGDCSGMICRKDITAEGKRQND
jgi:hypothetical protein